MAADATANGLATPSTAADYNAGMYAFHQAAMVGGAMNTGETVAITNAQGTYNVVFNTTTDAGGTVASAISAMNKQLAGSGIYAVVDSSAGGTGFTLQSASNFTINKTAADGTDAVFGTASSTGAITLNNSTPNSSTRPPMRRSRPSPTPCRSSGWCKAEWAPVRTS